jgi:hypothetical protein
MDHLAARRRSTVQPGPRPVPEAAQQQLVEAGELSGGGGDAGGRNDGLAGGVTIEHSLLDVSAASQRPDGHVPRP